MRLSLARLLLPAALLISACEKGPTNTPPEEPTPIRFEDGFGSNSLAGYTSHDLSGTLGIWRIDGSRLIAEGTANQNVLIRNDLTIADGYVEADIDRADDAGLVFRFQNAGNYYVLAVRDDSASLPTFRTDNIGFYRAVNGEFEWLAVGNVNWPRGPMRVRVEFQGAMIRVYFGGTYLGSITDYQYSRGGVGVRHMRHPSAPLSINSYDRFAAGEL